MKTFSKIFYYSLVLILFENQTSLAQGEWVTISPLNTFFSFSLPDSSPPVIDSNDVLIYNYQVDSDISMNCVFQKKDSSFASLYDSFFAEDSIPSDSVADSVRNPLIITTYLLMYQYNSVNVIYITEIDSIDSLITEREYAISFLDKNQIEQNFYLRAYYNGHDFLTFSAFAPASRSEDLVGYKNQFFDSIIINP